MTLPQLQLDNQLCFLFHRVGRELNAAYRPLLAELGLTYSQYLVMLVLWERDGVSVGELGDRLAVDSATLSPQLRRMERAGLVRRVRSQADERRVTVHLTARGAALEQRAAEIPAAMMSRLVDDEAQYRRLKGQLEHLLERIPAAAAPGGAGGGTRTLTSEDTGT